MTANRLTRWVAVVILTPLLGVALGSVALVAFVRIAAALSGPRDEPASTGGAYLLLAIAVTLVGLAVATPFYLLMRWLLGIRLGYGAGLPVLIPLVLGEVFGLLNDVPAPAPPGIDVDQIRATLERADRLFVEPSESRFDIVVVLDRGDRATRVLAQRAREHAEALAEQRDDVPHFDIAYGLAVIERSGRPRPWLEMPPPDDRSGLVYGLADLRTAPSRARSTNYARAVLNVAEDDDLWREETTKAVAIIVDELPALRDPEVRASQTARRDARARRRQDRFWACIDRYSRMRRRGSPTNRGRARIPCREPAMDPDSFMRSPNTPPSVPSIDPPERPPLRPATAWNDVLDALAANVSRSPLSPLRLPAPQLHVVARSVSPLMAARWRSLIDGIGGTVTVHPGRWPIDVLEDVVTERPPAWERELAIRYRPYLRFDSAETYVPLDVDAFLSEKGEQGPAHEACTGRSGSDDCTPLSDVTVLEDRDYVDVSGDAALVPDAKRPRAPPQRIYYRASRWDGGIHLDYWWFFRFNVSPVATRYMCLGGLAIPEVSCFDHEGDWEGVTVTLRATESTAGKAGRAYALQAVTYAGHAWRYRYDRRLLERLGSVANGHPVVYAAWGSHASFPLPCGRRQAPGAGSCRQLGSRLPDGRRDGGIDWRHNDDRSCRQVNCVTALPGSRDRGALLWNAFGGRWGREACTVGLKLCVRGKGPLSPAYQTRYEDPGDAPPGSEGDLLERAGLR